MPHRGIDRLAGLMVATGTGLSSIGLAGLIVAGLWWLNDAGLGGWLGWFNLSVLCGGWWLAWTWTRPGAVLPAVNWAPPPHFTENDKWLWERSRQEITGRSADLATAESPAAWLALVREIWEGLRKAHDSSGRPACEWRDKSLSELVAAAHAGQVRLRKRVENLLGHLLLPRIERWELAWKSGVLFDKYGLLAWLPGLILAPVDSLARYLAGWVVRAPAAKGIRRDSARILWELVLRDLAVVLVDFQAGRLKGIGSRYADKVDLVDSAKPGFRLLRPALLACTQSLPLVVMLGAGMSCLFSVHWGLVATCILMISGGGVLLVLGGRDWLFPPRPASAGEKEAGREAVEGILSGSLPQQASRIHDMASWIGIAERLDREVALVVSGSESGWRGRSLGEWLRGIESLSRELERLVRQAVPGSRHISIGSWLEAGGWLGWLGRVTSGGGALMSAIPSRGGLTGMAFSWVAGQVSRQMDDYLNQVLFRAVVRQTGKFLIELHSGQWRDPDKNVELNSSEEARPVLLIVGSAGAGCSTIAKALRELTEMAGWEIRESSSLWSTDSGSKGLSLVTDTARQADAVLLVVKAVGAARDPEIRLLDRLRESWRKGEVPPPLLGLLSAVDMVVPPLEWNPPYDPEKGIGRKEQSMRASLEAARKCFGERVGEWRLTGCRDGSWWGLSEGVVPWLNASLERARGVGLAREMASEGESRDWLEPAWQVGRGFQELTGFLGSGWKKAEPPA